MRTNGDSALADTKPVPFLYPAGSGCVQRDGRDVDINSCDRHRLSLVSFINCQQNGVGGSLLPTAWGLRDGGG